MHNAITRLNWWSGWGKLHVSQVLKFTQVWSSISAREHWVKQRKGEHWTSRGICKNWNEIKNKYIMIFKELFIKSERFMLGPVGVSENWEQTKRVFSPTSFPSPTQYTKHTPCPSISREEAPIQKYCVINSPKCALARHFIRTHFSDVYRVRKL